jgi:SAM-dependent methyltransferase
MNNEYQRIDWVQKKLQEIHRGFEILDAGCGRQQYKKFCAHLKYYSQDFGKYVADEKDSITASYDNYQYGRLDYVGNIWEVDAPDSSFDAILCTEVLEHVPHPNRTIKEFSRLLRPGGTLILTVPSNSLRHMDPYYFFSGFSDRYLEKTLSDYSFTKIHINAVGSYHQWLMVEAFRCMRHEGLLAMMLLMPAMLYHYIRQQRATQKEINTLCFGYHVTATLKET